MYSIKLLPKSFLASHNPAPKKSRAKNMSPVAEITPDAGARLSRYPGIQSEKHGFKGEAYDQIDAIAQKVLDNTIKAKKFYQKGQPALPYQMAGMLFALYRSGRAGLFDPMGLGKTTTAVLAISAGDAGQSVEGDNEPYLPALVVCPKSALPSWKNTFALRTNYDVVEIPSASKVKAAVESAKEGTVLLVTYETLRSALVAADPYTGGPLPDYYYAFSDEGEREEFASSVDDMEDEEADVEVDATPAGKKIKRYAPEQTLEAKALRDLITNKIKTIVFDEAHRLKFYGSDNTRVNYYLANKIPHVLALTGTPMLNDPGELASILNMLEPAGSVPYADYPVADEKLAKSLEALFLSEKTGLPLSAFKKSRTGHITFRNWEDEEPQKKLQQELYTKGTRHPRRLAVESGALGRFALREKFRSYLILPPSNERIEEVLAAIEKTKEVIAKSSRRQGKTSDKSDYANKLNAMSKVFAKFDAFLEKKKHLPKEERQKQLLSPSVATQFKEMVGKELYKGYIPIPTTLMKGMGFSVIDGTISAIANRINQTDKPEFDRPVVIFAYHKDVVKRLFEKLRNAFPNSRIYVADASRVSLAEKKSTELVPLRTPENVAKKSGQELSDFDELSRRMRFPDKLDTKDKRAIIILTRAGSEGLNLSAADTLLFIQRMPNPGVEAQAEDRINRPEQNVNPKIIYVIPNDPFSFALMSRIEKKRNHTRLVLGEGPQDDYSSEPKYSRKPDRVIKEMPQQFKDILQQKDGKESGIRIDDYLHTLMAELMPEQVMKMRYDKVMGKENRNPYRRESNEIELLDPYEEQIRRMRLAIFEQGLKKGYSPEEAKQRAFQIAGRRHDRRFLEPGTNTPTEESRFRAIAKITDDPQEFLDKRRRYEEMLAIGRKSGPRRVIAEKRNIFDGPIVYRVMPDMLTFSSAPEALRAMHNLNNKV